MLGQTWVGPGKRCEFNWSAQHLREVYSRESRNLRFFAGVDLNAARSCPGLIAHSRKGYCRSKRRAKGTARAVPFGYLPVVIVSRLTVVTAGPHATLIETYVRSRKGRGRSCPVSQIVPSRHGQRGDRA